MIILRNMDDLFDFDLPEGWIAAANVCACNPRKIPHYPADWYEVAPFINFVIYLKPFF